MAWIEPVTNRVAGSRTTYEDLNRICNNLLEKGFVLTKSVYFEGDFVTDSEWSDIVRFAKRGDSTVTNSTLYSNLNKLEAAIINAEPARPLNFTALESTDIKFTMSRTLPNVPTIQYSLNGTTWNNYTFGNAISLATGDRCYFKGDNSSFSLTESYYIKFSSTGDVNASGNVMSLLDSNMELMTVPNGAFIKLFEDCDTLLSSPELPATTLKSHCYRGMFADCTSLTTVPKLPAITLQTQCYSYMFQNCFNLKVYSTSGEGHDKAWRIPTDGTGTSGTYSMSHMFKGTIGDYSSEDNPPINTTYYTQNEPV